MKILPTLSLKKSLIAIGQTKCNVTPALSSELIHVVKIEHVHNIAKPHQCIAISLRITTYEMYAQY